MAQRIKRLLAIQETRVRSLGWEDPLEKEMATHSSILAWRIPWIEEPGGLQSRGLQRVISSVCHPLVFLIETPVFCHNVCFREVILIIDP